MNHELPERVIEQIRTVLARHPEVEKATLYGSRAKRTHRRGSDIDLSLKGRRLNDRLLTRIATELDDLLLPWQIDLCHFDRLTHVELIAHIHRVGEVWYQRKPAAVRRRQGSFARAAETLSTLSSSGRMTGSF